MRSHHFMYPRVRLQLPRSVRVGDVSFCSGFPRTKGQRFRDLGTSHLLILVPAATQSLLFLLISRKVLCIDQRSHSHKIRNHGRREKTLQSLHGG